LLRPRHIALNRPPRRVDISSKMSTPHHTEPVPTISTPADIETAARFAHELANLLDGSMRNVALVRSLLRGPNEDEQAAKEEADVLTRLQTAEQGMRKMASLIKNWMTENHRPARLHDSTETLGAAINQARDLHHPAASALGIDIALHITADAARLPAGPVFPVLANALRNSIEAISADPRRKAGAGLIEVRAQVQAGRVRIAIADNGPGLSRNVVDTGGIFRFGESTKPTGHGLGLPLCRDIAASLGGTLRVANREEGGAQVTLTYAVEAAADVKK
jgi:signal transduction histidine kinase